MGVTSAVRNAGKAVLKAVSPQSDEEHQDLLTTLKFEHNEVKGLLADLDAATTSAQRKALVRKIKEALIPHTKAEEKILYAALIKVGNKEVQTDGHEGNIEHDLAAKTLQKLSGISNSISPEHKAAAKVLRELVEHHIREEENSVWSDAREHFSEKARIALNNRYLQAKAQVKVS
jgi:iron-sulfur cluster repair protein YtfE (RIC family)